MAATGTITNAPSKFDLMLALFNDKVVRFTVLFEDGTESTFDTELWSIKKFGRNGYHQDQYEITGIMQGDGPLPGQSTEDLHWGVFRGKYSMRTRTGTLEFEISPWEVWPKGLKV